MKYYLYPGCAGEATTKEALWATQKLLTFLEVDYKESEAFSCCGAGIVEEEDPLFEYTINARNFAIAEKEGRDIFTICNTCFLTMLKAKKELQEDPKLFTEVNSFLSEVGLEYKGEVQIKHLLWILRDDIGLERIKSLVVNPLDDIKVAPFYGCHILRPSDVIEDDKEPDFLSKLIKACGAKEVEYEDKYNCCGFHILLADEETSLKMTEQCLSNANKVNIDALVTPCTLCHISLDCYQGRAKKGASWEVPVFHLAQIVGLAIGLKPKVLGLKNNLVSVNKVINLKKAVS